MRMTDGRTDGRKKCAHCVKYAYHGPCIKCVRTCLCVRTYNHNIRMHAHLLRLRELVARSARTRAETSATSHAKLSKTVCKFRRDHVATTDTTFARITSKIRQGHFKIDEITFSTCQDCRHDSPRLNMIDLRRDGHGLICVEMGTV